MAPGASMSNHTIGNVHEDDVVKDVPTTMAEL